MTNKEYINVYARKCHTAALNSGWWEGFEDRDDARKLILIYTEITEAGDGISRGDIQDDKIPEFRMEDAELADTAIRILDFMGRKGIDATGYYDHHLSLTTVNSHYISLFMICCHVSRAVEGNRRENHDELRTGLLEALADIFAHASSAGFDIRKTIDAKMVYNSFRADHKPENRAKKGGKKY